MTGLTKMGRPCKRGHSGERFVRNSECVTCSKIRKRWNNMVSRCNNPADPNYGDYGGRGITVCDRWVSSFNAFYYDIGYRFVDNPRLSLERKNVNKGYTPDNVKAASWNEQCRNKRNSVKIRYEGITKNLCDWSEDSGTSGSTIRRRMKERLLTPRDTLKEDCREELDYCIWGVSVQKRVDGTLWIVHGYQHGSLKEWCTRLECSLATVEHRIYQLGWTYAQALGFAPRKGNFKKPPIKRELIELMLGDY